MEIILITLWISLQLLWLFKTKYWINIWYFNILMLLFYISIQSALRTFRKVEECCLIFEINLSMILVTSIKYVRTEWRSSIWISLVIFLALHFCLYISLSICLFVLLSSCLHAYMPILLPSFSFFPFPLLSFPIPFLLSPFSFLSFFLPIFHLNLTYIISINFDSTFRPRVSIVQHMPNLGQY